MISGVGLVQSLKLWSKIQEQATNPLLAAWVSEANIGTSEEGRCQGEVTASGSANSPAAVCERLEERLLE